MMEINVFKNGYLRIKSLKRIPHNIKQFFKNIKAAYQRATKGIAYYDTWNFNSFLNHIFKVGLLQLKDTTHTYPIEYKTMEDWQAELQRIADLTDKLDTDYCERKYGIDDYEKINQEYKQTLNEFFTWMAENYCDLWD